jgi:ParB-like chromosome segregation protein Spo0J
MTGYQVMPRLSPDEYADLEQSIKENGVLVPITVSAEGGEIIDGHHRAEIAERLGVPCPQLAIGGPPALLRSLAFSLNLNRRHLNREQRRELIAQSLRSDPDVSDSEHARRTGVSDKTVATVRSDLESRSEIPNVPTRTDSAGRQQPAMKPGPSTQPPREPERPERQVNVTVLDPEVAEQREQRDAEDEAEYWREKARLQWNDMLIRAAEFLAYDAERCIGDYDPVKYRTKPLTRELLHQVRAGIDAIERELGL